MFTHIPHNLTLEVFNGGLKFVFTNCRPYIPSTMVSALCVASKSQCRPDCNLFYDAVGVVAVSVDPDDISSQAGAKPVVTLNDF